MTNRPLAPPPDWLPAYQTAEARRRVRLMLALARADIVIASLDRAIAAAGASAQQATDAARALAPELAELERHRAMHRLPR